MKTFTSIERFEIINKCLGYGNPNAIIYFIGLEEKHSWELNELIPSENENKAKILVRLNDLDEENVESKIKIIKNEFGLDFENIVNTTIEDYQNNTDNFVYACEPNNEISKTSNIQDKLSKELLIVLNKYDEEYDWDNYSRSIFGTKKGNEACLNYFPIARPITKKFYNEEQYFFGLSDKNKFLNSGSENQRINYFEILFKMLKSQMKDRDIFIFLMGQPPYINLKEVIESVFYIDFSENSGNDSFILNDESSGNKMIANKERNIWSVNHPTAYEKDNPFSIDDITIVINEIKRNYKRIE